MPLLKPRPIKINAEVANRALIKRLDPKVSGKSFFGKLSGKIYRLLKSDPEAKRYLRSDTKSFKSKVPEGAVYRILENLRKEGKALKFSERDKPLKSRQQFLKDLRGAGKLPSKDTAKFFELGEKKFQDWKNSQNQSSNLNPAELQFQKVRDQLELAKRLEQEDRAQRFQSELDRLKLAELKNDPLQRGEYIREAVDRRVHSNGAAPANESRREVNNDNDQESRNETDRNRESRSPIDPLGPYDLAA